MGLFDTILRAFQGPESGLENPNVSLIEAIAGADALDTATGVRITPERALGQTAVYAAVRVLSESLASLPFPVYRREGRSRLPVPDDFRWPLLNLMPNPEQTAMECWEMEMAHTNLWGNGYLYKLLDPAGRVSLWPLPPWQVQPERLRETNTLVYRVYLDNGDQVTLLPDEVIHFRAFSTKRGVGLSPIGLARQSLGIQVAAEEYGARFFANDARPGGVIEYQGDLTTDEHKDLVRKWKHGHQSLKRSHLIAILDKGAKWNDVGLPPGDAQFLETRKYGVAEAARIFRVPRYKIADLDQGAVSYASVEQQSIDFVIDSIRPWSVRFEQKIHVGLFQGPSDAGLYPQFKLDGLLRGDTITRYQAYALGRMWGWLSANDIRELEDQTGIGPEGDIYLQPANMVPAGTELEGLRGILTPAMLAKEPQGMDLGERLALLEREVEARK